MGATAAQIAEVRRMTAEPLTTTYSDAVISGYIERYPLLDVNGEEPTWLDMSTTPPTVEENKNWIATYDLHAAAADIWQEKAAALAALYDFSADGGSYQRSQAHEAAMGQARYHRSRRAAGTIALVKWPKESSA